MLDRLFPGQFDNSFRGYRGAFWLLGLFIALKLAMSLNAIFNTVYVATGPDGLPLASYGPAASRTVLMLFALNALGQLVLALIALLALIRYRTMIPLLFLILLGEQIARRFIVSGYEIARTASGGSGAAINYGIVALLALGLLLSLLGRQGEKA
jgi:hypothetical protein